MKKGDSVVCINADHSFNRLSKGGTYTVDTVKGCGDDLVIFAGGAAHSLDRFKLVEQPTRPLVGSLTKPIKSQQREKI